MFDRCGREPLVTPKRRRVPGMARGSPHPGTGPAATYRELLATGLLAGALGTAAVALGARAAPPPRRMDPAAAPRVHLPKGIDTRLFSAG